MNNGSLQEISWENVVSRISDARSFYVILRVCKMLNILTAPKLQQTTALRIRGYWQSCFTCFDQAKGCDLNVDTTGSFGVVGSGLCKFCNCDSDAHSQKFWLRGCWWGNYISLGQKYPGEGVYSSHLLLLDNSGKLLGSYCAFSHLQPLVQGGFVYAERKLEQFCSLNSLSDAPPEGVAEFAVHNYKSLEVELCKIPKTPNLANKEYYLGNWDLLLNDQKGTILEVKIQFTDENNMAIKGRVASYSRWLLEEENMESNLSQSLYANDPSSKEVSLALLTTYADMVAIAVSIKNTTVDGAKFSISFLGKKQLGNSHKLEGKFFFWKRNTTQNTKSGQKLNLYILVDVLLV